MVGEGIFLLPYLVMRDYYTNIGFGLSVQALVDSDKQPGRRQRHDPEKKWEVIRA